MVISPPNYSNNSDEFLQFQINENISKIKKLGQRLEPSKNSNCDFIDLCRFCTQSNSKIKCCLFRRINGQISPRRCSDKKCISLEDCEKAIEGNLTLNQIPSIEDFFKYNNKVRKPLLKFFEPYYPKIEIESEKRRRGQIELAKKLRCRGVLVSLQKVFSPNKEYFVKENLCADLHDLLRFKGQIILATNIKDNFCKEILDHVEKIPKMIDLLNPDVITTLDANFYSDQPSFITAIQLDKVLKANERISNLKVRQIGLVPPAADPFYDIGLLNQLKANHKTIGIPLLEISKYRIKFDQQRIIRRTLEFQSKFNFKFILLSTSPNYRLKADSFSSLSWVMVPKSYKYTIEEKLSKMEEALLNYRRIATDITFQKQLNKFGRNI